MPLSDFSGIIPREYSQQIIDEVEQQSAVLQLATVMPMGTRITELPVTGKLPTAQWVTGTNAPPAGAGRKPYSDLQLKPQVITAEEIATVVAIPDQYLEDNTINLWNWARPKLAEAIARRFDETVIFGGAGIPATFPVGGIISDTYSMRVGQGGAYNAITNPFPTAIDAVDAVNNAMSYVEGQGLNVVGHSADIGAKGQFRGVRDQTGSLLLGTEQVGNSTRPTLYGEPIRYSQYAAPSWDFITGAWDYLVVGVRQDIRFRIDPSATIADPVSGMVLVSGFQDNVTPMKVWARFGCTIVKPVTPRVPAGAVPFARTRLLSLTRPPGAAILANHPHGPVDPPLGDEPGTDEPGNGDEGDEPGRRPIRPGRGETQSKK
jgi:HK97 family phage major capsid protein